MFQGANSNVQGLRNQAVVVWLPKNNVTCSFMLALKISCFTRLLTLQLRTMRRGGWKFLTVTQCCTKEKTFKHLGKRAIKFIVLEEFLLCTSVKL